MERKHFKVQSVGTTKPIGKSHVTQFRSENDEIVYEVWGDQLLEVVKVGAQFDGDIEYSEKESQGQVYKHHKLTQIYVNGQPVLHRKAGGYSGRGGGKSPEEIASIEAQVAVKAVISLFSQPGEQLNAKGTVLLDKALRWCEEKIDAALRQKPAQTAPRVTEQPKEVSLPEPKAIGSPYGEGRPTPPPNNSFANAGQFLTKAQEVFSMNRSQVLAHPEVNELFDKGDFSKAYLKLAEVHEGGRHEGAE